MFGAPNLRAPSQYTNSPKPISAGVTRGVLRDARFEDRYEAALKPAEKKQSGQKIEAPREREPSKVINLMELRAACRTHQTRAR
jgi:hypothetical protein